jgi:hypothetical protein
VLDRFAYVPIEIAREAKNPLRRRFKRTRMMLDRSSLRAQALAQLRRHPLSVLSGLIGAVDPHGPVWGVTVVKDEAVRLEGALRRLVAGGVDVVVVADNRSTDSTRELLQELAGELPLLVLDYRDEAFYQGQAISLLARSASRCGASWIVPFDADELWFGVDGTIKEELHSCGGDAAVADMYDFLPHPDVMSSADPYSTMLWRTREPVIRKVAFRAHLLASVSSGAHLVSQPTRRVYGHLRVRHYPYLGFQHFAQKGKQRVEARDRTDLPKNISGHLRRLAALDDTELRDEWRRICTEDLVEDPLPPHSF